MLKLTITFEMDEEQLRDLFDSYDIKFTKAKITKLKKIIKEYLELNGDDYFALELQSDFESVIGNIIQEEFES
jgi:hypothetical protein